MNYTEKQKKSIWKIYYIYGVLWDTFSSFLLIQKEENQHKYDKYTEDYSDYLTRWYRLKREDESLFWQKLLEVWSRDVNAKGVYDSSENSSNYREEDRLADREDSRFRGKYTKGPNHAIYRPRFTEDPTEEEEDDRGHDSSDYEEYHEKTELYGIEHFLELIDFITIKIQIEIFVFFPQSILDRNITHIGGYLVWIPEGLTDFCESTFHGIFSEHNPKARIIRMHGRDVCIYWSGGLIRYIEELGCSDSDSDRLSDEKFLIYLGEFYSTSSKLRVVVVEHLSRDSYLVFSKGSSW